MLAEPLWFPSFRRRCLGKATPRLSSDEDDRLLRQSRHARAEPGLAVLRRFLPYLWPAGEPALKARVLLSLRLGAGLDRRHHAGHAARLRRRDQPDDGRAWSRPSRSRSRWSPLMPARASAACCSTICATAIFERVGQDATRRLAETTSSATSTICRCASTSSGAPARSPRSSSAAPRASTRCSISCCSTSRPTVLELGIVLVIFWVKFGLGLVAATLVMVALYIRFTRMVTDWRDASCASR